MTLNDVYVACFRKNAERAKRRREEAEARRVKKVDKG